MSRSNSVSTASTLRSLHRCSVPGKPTALRRLSNVW
jgi:hypothetical protein